MTNRLRELRLNAKKTQVAVAGELGIPRGSYAPIESGAYLPTQKTLEDLTHILKCKDVEIYAGVYLEIIKIESHG